MCDDVPNSEGFSDSLQGGAPKEWRCVKLSEACDLQVGYAFRSEWFSDYDGMRLLRGENVGYGIPDWSDTKRLPDNYSRRFAEYILRSGDVVIGMDRTFTKSGVKVSVLGPDDSPALLVQRVGRFEPRAAIRGFMVQLLRWSAFHRELLAQQKGMDIPHLSKAEILSPYVPLPDGEEQRRIAEILNTLDETIRKTEQLIAKMKQVKQGLLHDLLTRGIDANGELRDPERHPEQFKDSPLGRIPKAWEARPFRPYGATDRAYLKTGPFGSSLKQKHWVKDGVPVITIGALGEGEFIASELLHVSDETARHLAAYAVRPGDIVFSRVADVGRSVVVTEPQHGWLMSSNLMWIAVDRRRASPSFVQANLSSNSVVGAQIRRFVNSGGRDVANAAVLNSIVLPWPPLAEQERVAGIRATAEDQLSNEASALTKLRLIKDGLMEDLLAGRVRVTNLLSEAAA